jgi:hypothetical protein
MDCRTFHRKLEDYLEGGLDFPARFGVERHAKQCYACEKDVTEAMRLRRMARELERVAAPPNFETALLAKIQAGKLQHRFWHLQNLWFYGFEEFRWRLAGATALITICIVSGVYYLNFGTGTNQATALQAAASRSSSQLLDANTVPPAQADFDLAGVSARNIPASKLSQPVLLGRDPWTTPFVDPDDSDYVQVLVPVSDGRQLIMQLPKTIHMRYGPPSRDYFLRYVSH